MPNRPSATSTLPQTLPPPPAPKPGSFWNQFPRQTVPPTLSALPCHLGDSPRAPPPVHVQQQQAPLMMQMRQPPTSVPRNRWEFRSTQRPVEQQSRHSGSCAKSSTSSSSLGTGGRGQEVAAGPTPVQQQQRSPPRGRESASPAPVTGIAATDLGPLGFSLQRIVRVRNPSPGTASRLPSFSYDWVCCFCHRNNNESQHPLHCTNPACLHVRVVDNRKGKEKGRPIADQLIYRPFEPKVPGVEVCPDCSYVTYQWLDGGRVPEPVQNPLGMPAPRR